MDTMRPDPDALLSRLQVEEARSGRGRLQVYLGMCPGVGKTYAMLEGAQEDRAAGRAVVVGIVETHGRVDTEALLDGLSILPRRQISHRGITLSEFDLDAALAAKPAILLVDEMAHTNAVGSRHGKRWQDVRELIQAGIDVRTTLNIQHVESLNDVVAQITGVRMRETVPDSVLDEADEVVLVDLPPDELRERMEAGKVYLGAQAARAADGFFTPSNLTALRELALRFVAGRVGRQVRFHREASASAAIWPTQERILVAVGPAPSSATLVRAAKRLASTLGAEWFALFVETPRALSPENRQRVTDHLRLAESLGAKTASVSATDVSDGVLKFARRENVTKLVVGKPIQPRWRELLRPSPVDELVRRSGDIDVYVIRGEQRQESPSPVIASERRPGALKVFVAPFVATAAAVLLGKAVGDFVTLPDVAMIFLLASGGVALLGSRRAAILMAALGVLAFNFFFIPPVYTLHVAGTEYLITFAVLLIASLSLSEVTLRLRAGQDLARRSEERTAAVYRLSATLAERRGSHDVVEAAINELATDLDQQVAICTRDLDGTLRYQGTPLDEKDRAVVRWVMENGQPAGRGTATLASSSLTHHPLVGPRGILGVVSLRGESLAPQQEELLHALLRHTALVLSVETLNEDRARTAAEMDAERLRNSILSAVSHDLRTPLASILGSASSLQEQADSLDPATRSDLLSNIIGQADRLNRLIANLLEMTKIEGGTLRLNRVPLPVDEIVGASLGALRQFLPGLAVTTSIPADLPFVEADELLIQQVLINLLENAAKHTPAGTPIRISAVADTAVARVTIVVSDEGPGLPEAQIPRLFERFFRGDHTVAGAGLGLAICKGIVQAHGGTISASNRTGGGAEFRFTLPVADVDLKGEEFQ